MRLLATATLFALILTMPGSSGVTAQTGAPSLLLLSKYNAVVFPPTTTGVAIVSTATITNGGTGDLVISSASIAGANAADFAIASNGCGTVAPNGLCSITIRFTPSANGPRSGRLVVANNASGAPHVVALEGRGIDPTVPQPAVGPIDPRFGFPVTYTDSGGTTVELCLGDPFCLPTDPPYDPTQPPSVTDTNINFPAEAFWWTGEAAIDNGAVDALLVLAQEAAFVNENPAVNDQAAFGRLRIRVDAAAAGWYRFTHPFGVDEVESDGTRIFSTSDIGCFGFPCDFTASFASRITRFLSCVAPVPPAGYLGDVNVECTVTGSPVNQNFFRVERISGPGGAVTALLGETNLFTITGKLASAATLPPPPANILPVAVADAATTAFNTAVTVAVLANDSDANGDPLVLSAISVLPVNGTAVISGGSIVYTPNTGYSGFDALTYQISDGRGGFATAVVNLTVRPPVNNPPVAVNDVATTDQDLAVTVSVLANDSDPNGDALILVSAGQGLNGATALNAGGTITYTPFAGFSGADFFSYTIADGRGGSAIARVDVTVNPVTPPPPPVDPTLVLALGFNEAAGTTVSDASAAANNGTISGATRSAGRAGSGGALTFDGINDWVTVPDAASLDLSNAMTIEAWVRPTALGAGVWRTILLKEGTGNMAYELYANNDLSRPAFYGTFAGVIRPITGTAALALNAWTHVAVTYDGANMRMYVNGVLVRTVARTGSMLATAGPLHIGGNQVWGGEWFAGQIDEVRIYRRALTQAEIQTDMDTPIQ